MRRLLALSWSASLAAGLACPRAHADAPAVDPSRQGYSGLLDSPSAEVAREGAGLFAYSRLRSGKFTPADIFSIQLAALPFLEIAGRVIEGPEGSGLRDLSFNAKLQLPLHLVHPALPKLALGAQDYGGVATSSYYQARYVVASKHLGPARLSLGWGAGPSRLDGVFGGLELSPARWLTLVGEYDAEAWNAGARVMLGMTLLDVPLRVGGALMTTLEGDRSGQLELVAMLEGSLGRVPGALPAPPPAPGPLDDAWEPPFPPPAEPDVALPDEPASAGDLADVADALVRAGFENVRVGEKAGRVAYVVIENNRFLHDELDGIGVALGIVARHAPKALEWIVLVIEKTRVPLREVWVPRAAFAAFVAGEPWARGALERQAEITPCLSGQDDVRFVGVRRNGSLGRAQIVLQPGIQTYLATEVGSLEVLLSLRPELIVTLWPGAVLDARWNVPLLWTEQFGTDGAFSGDRDAAHTEHALLRQVGGLAPGLVGQVGVGLYRKNKLGGLGEVLWTSPDGILQARGRGAYFRDRHDLELASLLGGARVFLPWWDASIEVTGGQFLYRDRGLQVEASRFFGDVEVGLFYRRSEGGEATRAGDPVEWAGIQVALPLTPRREMASLARTQVRGTSRFRYEQSTTIRRPMNTFFPRAGLLPETSYTLPTVFANRGRLGTTYLREHLGRLRDAYLRYGLDGAQRPAAAAVPVR